MSLSSIGIIGKVGFVKENFCEYKLVEKERINSGMKTGF